MLSQSRSTRYLRDRGAAILGVVIVAALALVPTTLAHADPAPLEQDGMTFTALGPDPASGAAVTSYDMTFGPSVTIPSSVPIGGAEYPVIGVGAAAFQETGLTTVTLPDSITQIDDYAFFRNELSNLELPRSLTAVGEFAFAANELTSVTIPAQVTSLGAATFAFMELTEVWFAGNVAPEITGSGQFGTFGDAVELLLNYHCDAAGFSYPVWKKYDTQAICTVSFDSTGGSAVPASTVTLGKLVAEPHPPVREGSTFVDWYLDPAATARFDFATPVETSMTLYAGWELRTYTVTFESAGGTQVSPGSVKHGGTLTEPAETTRDGHSFTGWYTDDAATIRYDFTSPVSRDLTLYAGWEIDSYSVAFDSRGGSAVNTATVVHGATVTPPAPPTREGFTFSGWSTDAAGKSPYDFDTAVTGELTLYAGWNADTRPEPPVTPEAPVTPDPPGTPTSPVTPPPPGGGKLATTGGQGAGWFAALGTAALLGGAGTLLARRQHASGKSPHC